MSSAPPERPVFEDSDVRAAIEYARAHLECARGDRHIPGLSAAFVCEGETVWSGGFGYADAETQRPADADTVYPLASITKVVTCTAMMCLRDAGKLQLDDPLARHLPGLGIENPFPEAHAPTLRQIASHTAGFQRETPFDCWETFVFPGIDELLESLPRCQMIVPPLTEDKYSNLAFALLGHALSLVAGRPYDEYVRDTILSPLGMSSSSYAPTGEAATRLATLYPWADDEGPGKAGAEMKLGCFGPVGGLHSTASDLSRFAALHLGHPPTGGEGVLSQASVKEMQTLQWLSADWQSGRGIGWHIDRVSGKQSVGHSGGLPGLSTHLQLVPEAGLAVAVLTNGRGAAAEVCRETVEILVPPVGRALKRRKPKEPDEAPEEWQRYVGRYQSTMGKLVVQVLILDGKLLARDVGGSLGDAIRLTPKAEHVFTMESGGSKGEPAAFELDEQGNVVKMKMGGYPFHRKLD